MRLYERGGAATITADGPGATLSSCRGFILPPLRGDRGSVCCGETGVPVRFDTMPHDIPPRPFPRPNLAVPHRPVSPYPMTK
jgi:hypothetical protein